ncbi:D-glycero-beta-D-manno-heptose-7-phosphate kinase [Candidatus Pseudothioglobus singularis]|jgi:D-beta-D-heptose 7-phosphate kinase / D-beta-D-heptose 1-phosphate adenosyltransferase|nr:D-glycero-beta-D-manno-heptose-7-phosphate kinase [Candidatus Pseudothioglobus singularis]
MINLQNKSPKLLVIGDLIIDQYLWGSCERISPEAPVQVIDVGSESSVLGGAGNVVSNLKRLGAKVDVISVVGNCAISSELKTLLKEIKINTKYLIIQENRVCSKKTRIVASQQQVVRFDRESSNDINTDSQNIVLETFKKIVKNYDVILLSDYGKGVLTNHLTKSLIYIANQNNKKVLIDPKGHDYLKYKGAYLLTPNKKEASEATNINITDDASLKAAIIKLKSLCDLNISLITLSENGLAIYDDKLHLYPTIAKEVFDVTGAGDTVLASLGFAMACGLPINEVIEFSNLAAGVVVGKIGSATASINEINEYESRTNKITSAKLIKSNQEIVLLVQELKARNKKIVFTNGCFDILHAGHISYLESAKSFGDILILGLNSDRSVTKLKGKKRPINNQDDRAYILAAIEVVDYVIIFDEDTPYELIKVIKPNILVKGGDYKGQEVIGQDIVEELKLVEFLNGKSSTRTIEKIKQNI